MKEMTNVAEAMMTEEDKEAMEKERNPDSKGEKPTAGPSTVNGTASEDLSEKLKEATIHDSAHPEPSNAGVPPAPPYTGPTVHATTTEMSVHGSAAASGNATPTPTSPGEKKVDGEKEASHVDRKGKGKLTPEQRKKLEEIDAARKKAMEVRWVAPSQSFHLFFST